MKKLYRKGTVHPSPPAAPAKSDDRLSFLPAVILSLAAALSPEEKELLAYLLLYNATKKNSSSWFSGASDHAPEFGCDCFRCYMSYWARWDSSPNHQLIHDIIEAYEDHHRQSLDNHLKKKAKNGKKEKRKNNGREKGNAIESKRTESVSDESTADSNSAAQLGEVLPEKEREEGSVSTERGSSNVRRLTSFIGEKIWGVWG